MNPIVRVHRRHRQGPALTRVAGLVALLWASTTAAAQARPPRGAVAPATARRVAAVAPTPAIRDSLRRAIARMVDSAGLPSLAVGVSIDGQVVFSEGFGFADVAARRRTTPDTPYSLASISKPITATAILQLVERGLVDLDAPANAYLRVARLTGLGGSADSATVRRLLSHTGGLPLHYRFYYAAPDDDAVPTPDVAATIQRYGIVVHPPGSVYNYSNLGYGVLGEIVAAVTGTRYEDYLRDHLFAPLGMRNSTVGTGAHARDAAVRYDAAGRPVPYYDFDHRGASAVYSSVHDLLRFAALHLGVRREAGDPVVSASVLQLMQQPATPPTPSGFGYGLGWAIDEDHGVRRVRHTGGMPGVNTVLAMYPDARVAVVALANQPSAIPGRVASDLAALVMPSYARARAAPAAAPPAQRADGASAPAAFAAPDALRGAWRGTVRMYDRSVPMELWVGDADIRVRLGDQPALWSLLNGASFQNGMLGGRFVGSVPTDDARRVSHVVVASLRLQDGVLRGWLAAQADVPTNDFSLSSYVDLVKAEPRDMR